MREGGEAGKEKTVKELHTKEKGAEREGRMGAAGARDEGSPEWREHMKEGLTKERNFLFEQEA